MEFDFSRRSFIGGGVSAVELSARVRGADQAEVTWDLKGLRRAVEPGVGIETIQDRPDYAKHPTGCEIFQAKWPGDSALPKGCDLAPEP